MTEQTTKAGWPLKEHCYLPAHVHMYMYVFFLFSDPMLTPENVISVMDEVELWDESESYVYLDMHYETYRALLRRHGRGRAGKIALVENYLSYHPYPRWVSIIELVEVREKSGLARAGLAQDIRDKYVTSK